MVYSVSAGSLCWNKRCHGSNSKDKPFPEGKVFAELNKGWSVSFDQTKRGPVQPVDILINLPSSVYQFLD
jgi:hypothetical protein